MMSAVSTTYLSLGHELSMSASFHKKENHSHLETETACKNTTTWALASGSVGWNIVPYTKKG